MHVVSGGVIYMQMYKAENRSEPCGSSASIPFDARHFAFSPLSEFQVSKKTVNELLP
jgi:hypothetical protein